MRVRDFLLLWLALSAAPVFAVDTVRLAVGEWVPYTSEVHPEGRMLQTVVTEAFKLEGVSVVYGYFPWKRSYIQAEMGEYDGTFPWNKTPERVKAFHFPKLSLVKDESVFFHLKSTPFDWQTLQDLKKFRVGVTLGYKEEISFKEQGILAEVVPTEELNFRKMLLGRIDVYQTSKSVGYSTINAMFSPEEAKLFTHHPKPVSQGEYFVLFSKKTPRGQELAAKFDEGLKKLKASGAYAKIMSTGPSAAAK